MKRIFFLTVVFSLVLINAFAANTLYVQSARAKLMGGPKFNSELKGYVKKGDGLKVLETGEGWYKVSTGAVEGWINRLCVSETQPMNKISVIAGNGAGLEEKSRRRASAITSAAAARGLREADRKRLNEKGAPDYTALETLQALAGRITDKDIQDFQGQGGAQ